jgi:serine/threonine protein kinase
LLAVGIISIKDTDGMTFPYPIDIFPYCPEGDLGRSGKAFSFYELKNKIIPSLCSALKAILENNLIHRDIKLGNIYELNGETVVSDFGTAVFVEDSSEDISYFTELARQTPGYGAREVTSRYAKKASDYFSLGCTLATLYNRKHPYETILM